MQSNAVLTLARHLRDLRDGVALHSDDRDRLRAMWETALSITPGLLDEDDPPHEQHPLDQQSLLARHVTGWLHAAAPVPVFQWEEEESRIEFVPKHAMAGGLFCVIAVDLINAVAGSRGLYACSICHKTFNPERKPRSDAQATYCSSCRQSGKVNARYQQQHRARKRARKEGS